MNRVPYAASRWHELRVFPSKRACPHVPSPHPSMSLSCQCWSSLPPATPSPKWGREDCTWRRGTRRGEAMPLSPPCNANRNRKGPNSKVLIQAKPPWPQVEAWGPSPAGGMSGPGVGHSSVQRALWDEGAELCDGPAATGAGVHPSICCISGPKVPLCWPSSRQRLWQLSHQVSPEPPQPGRGCQSSGTSTLQVPVVLQVGSGEAGTAGTWSQGTMGVTTCPSLQMTPRQRAAAGMAPPP